MCYGLLFPASQKITEGGTDSTEIRAKGKLREVIFSFAKVRSIQKRVEWLMERKKNKDAVARRSRRKKSKIRPGSRLGGGGIRNGSEGCPAG